MIVTIDTTDRGALEALDTHLPMRFAGDRDARLRQLQYALEQTQLQASAPRPDVAGHPDSVATLQTALTDHLQVIETAWDVQHTAWLRTNGDQPGASWLTAQHPDGTFIASPLIAARAQTLAALAYLTR